MLSIIRHNPHNKFNSLKAFSKLHELADSKPLTIVDEAGILIYLNNAFAKMFGLSEGDTISSINSEPSLKEVIGNLIEGNYKGFSFDTSFADEDNNIVQTLQTEVNRVLIAETEYFIFTFNTLEERVKIEERITNLSNALEYGDVPVIIIDKSGKINFVSKSFESILNKNIRQLFNAYLPAILEEFLTPKNLTELENSISDKQIWTQTITDIGESGELWYKEIVLNPVSNPEVETGSFIVTAHDITHLIQKTRLIKKSEQRQKLILANISDPLLIIRKEKEQFFLENINENFCRDFTITKSDAIEKTIDNILPRLLVDKIEGSVPLVKKSVNNQITFQFSSAQNLREYLCKLSFTETLFDRKELFILTLVDITEQLKTERMLRVAYDKQTKLNKLKSAFLANMSHEIRTPLNAVVGYSDLLQDDIEDKQYDALPELVAALKEGVDRLLTLVDNVVEVSMIESGDIKIEPERVLVNNILSSVCANLQKEADKNSIQFDFDLLENEQPIFVDPIRIEKVFFELIHNSIKYNKKNGIVLIRTLLESDRVIIEISDTGIGIDEYKLHHILEPFSQVDDEGYKRNYEGAGLGLTIAYNLTRLLKGKFEVETRINEGTTIRLVFPAVF